jgi:SPW repeat-containing protein
MNRRSEQWQDTVNIIASVWLFISPWVLGYAGGQVQAWNAWIVAVVVFVLSIASLAQFQRWEEWINVLLGIWLILSPWILRFSTASRPTSNAVIVGIIIGVLALWNALERRTGLVSRT